MSRYEKAYTHENKFFLQAFVMADEKERKKNNFYVGYLTEWKVM